MQLKSFFWLICLSLSLFSCESIMTNVKNSQSDTSKSEMINQKPTKLDFEAISVSYPTTPQDSTISDNYFGKTVADPFRWLEDDNAPNTKKWVKTQNRTTFTYLDQIPYREAIEERMKTLWNYQRVSLPFKEGDSYFLFKNDGLQGQDVLYRMADLKEEGEVVLNPNDFSQDGTASLGSYSFSKSGQYLAYQISEGGSDWRTVKVKDLNTGKVLEDEVNWVKFSGMAWAGDGFYYSRYPEPSEGDALSGSNEFHQVFYHTLGTPQSEDQLIFADRSNGRRGFWAETTHDEQFVILGIWESTSGNAIHFKKQNEAGGSFTPIYPKIEDDFNLVDNDGDRLLILTNHDAPNNRLIAVSTKNPEKGYWEEIIPETDDVLQRVDLLGNKLVATYIHNASSMVKLFDLKGKEIGEIELPSIGKVEDWSGKRTEDMAFFTFSSLTRPTSVYQVDLSTGKVSLFSAPEIDFDSEQYVTEQVWFESYDKTRVPMFVTHKKGLKLDGKRPTLLYGYGGFDISILPMFNTTRLNLALAFLENDGVFAIANIRGGGEFGKAWHKAGTQSKKQNVFNDFQAAAEHLIAQRYTSSDKLAIYGRSNGGLLIGACMTQRPDLYAVALPAVGVLDMLRYQHFTIGHAWASDYGLSEEEAGFDYLYSYSPLHNVEEAAYPATMVTTADHDDRVVPAHSFKFAAELQRRQQGKNPVLIRIDTSAGHGAGKPTSKKIEEAADILAFTFWNMKEEWK